MKDNFKLIGRLDYRAGQFFSYLHLASGETVKLKGFNELKQHWQQMLSVFEQKGIQLTENLRYVEDKKMSRTLYKSTGSTTGGGSYVLYETTQHEDRNIAEEAIALAFKKFKRLKFLTTQQ